MTAHAVTAYFAVALYIIVCYTYIMEKKNTLKSSTVFTMSLILLAICVSWLVYRIAVLPQYAVVQAKVVSVDTYDRTDGGRQLMTAHFEITVDYSYNRHGYITKLRTGTKRYDAGTHIPVYVKKNNPKKAYVGSIKSTAYVVIGLAIWNYLFYKIAIDPKNRIDTSKKA